jgi:hypothetical protein
MIVGNISPGHQSLMLRLPSLAMMVKPASALVVLTLIS